MGMYPGRRRCTKPGGSTGDGRSHASICSPARGAHPASSSPSPTRRCGTSAGRQPPGLASTRSSARIRSGIASPRTCSVRCRTATRFSQPPTRVLPRVPSAQQRKGLRGLSAHALSAGLDRLCQATLWRTRTRPSLPGPLHPSRGHLQPSPALGLRLRDHLSLEGLRARQYASHHAPLPPAVLAPLLTTPPPQNLPPHPFLRLT